MNSKKTKIILSITIAIFVILTSLLLYLFVKLQSTKEYTNAMEVEIVEQKNSIQAFDALVKNAQNIQSDSEKANTFFIKRDEVVSFLDTIESLAKITNTEVLVQSVSDKDTANNSKLLSVVLYAKGSYSNLHYLIRMLEELPYQTEIQNIRLSNLGIVDDKKQSVAYWSADINIVGVMF